MMPIQRTESLTTRPMRNRGARTFRPLEVTGLPHSAATSASTSVTEIQSSQASFGFTLPTTPARRNPSSLRPAYAGTGRGAVSPSGFAKNSRRTSQPWSASTTTSRSPSPTSSGIAFPGTDHPRASTPSTATIPSRWHRPAKAACWTSMATPPRFPTTWLRFSTSKNLPAGSTTARTSSARLAGLAVASDNQKGVRPGCKCGSKRQVENRDGAR